MGPCDAWIVCHEMAFVVPRWQGRTPWWRLQVGTKQFDLRFWDQAGGTFDIEASLQVSVCPGPAARWTAWPSESPESALAVDEAGAWSVQAGAPFSVLLELEDAFGNRCATRPAAPSCYESSPRRHAPAVY